MRKTIIAGVVLAAAIAGVAYAGQDAATITEKQAKEQGLMLVAVDTTTGNVIPDFQTNARPGTLKANAIAAGFSAANVQEQWVTKAEFETAMNAFASQTAAQRAVERAAMQSQLDTLEQKARATWNDQELYDLQELILKGLRFNANPTH